MQLGFVLLAVAVIRHFYINNPLISYSKNDRGKLIF